MPSQTAMHLVRASLEDVFVLSTGSHIILPAETNKVKV
jgi:hypothetical protein